MLQCFESNTMMDDATFQILACPQCGASLNKDGMLQCQACHSSFPRQNQQIDFRLKKTKSVQLAFQVGESAEHLHAPDIHVLTANPHPNVDFSKIHPSRHLSPEMLSYFPRAQSAGSLMLDLGSGDTVHRAVCEQAGFKYISLDYEGSQPDFLGDAHALPFRDQSFDFVLSMAVIEHLQNPFAAILEIARVLKPGGTFIGTVAFLEPFHSRSYYHHSPLGIWNLLRYGNFQTSVLGSVPGWSGKMAISVMSDFPEMPRSLIRMLVAPLSWLPPLWKRLYLHRTRESVLLDDSQRTAGSFFFAAAKPI